ncbi:unnamed protein product [Symbiodinium pilosum]|uniref:PARP catalytic domain-containing protein n=1 Tax=Symbiodinium pilosum TaxID=2952 RepID=A0A812QYK2_SYMPI|nr:unnamed protein product [Symbiodinium pilosum]
MLAFVLLFQAVQLLHAVGSNNPAYSDAEALLDDDECQSGMNSDQCAMQALQIDRATTVQGDSPDQSMDNASNTTLGSGRWLLTLYHQTSESAGRSILKHGFRPGHVGWCGAGIYFAMSPEATSGKIKGPESKAGFIIEAKVDVGHVKHMPWHCTTSPSCRVHPMAKCQDRRNRGSWLAKQGYNSINFQPDAYGPEYVIYDTRRVVSMKGYRYHR